MAKLKEGFSGERALVLPRSVVRTMEEDEYASLLHMTDIGYYPRAHFHYRRRDQPLDQYVFLYCTTGAGWVSVGGSRFPVPAGRYVILPPGVPHAYGADEADPWTIYWVHFKGTLAGRLAGRVGVPVELLPGNQCRINDRIALFEEVFNVLEMGYSPENLLYACSAFHHFMGTLRLSRAYHSVGAGSTTGHDAVADTIRYMKENLERRLTLGDLCSQAGLSPARFSELFRDRTGYPPIRYFNLLKIRQACHLLDFTRMKVKQVCYKVGFEDCYYFSRLFRQFMGVSPSQYRLQAKG